MNFGLYVIMTNPVLPYTKIAEICVKQKIRYLQLREKEFDDKNLLKIAREIKSITKGSETMFIVNDRVDICMLSDADGIHLGQEDISFNDARMILPKEKIIGLSTHNIEQAQSALELDPNYIGFGPIYSTPTKKKPDPVVGCKMLSKIMAISEIPVVAIGGIDESNLIDVLKTGAKNICMVRAFMNTMDLENKLIKIKMILGDIK